MNNKYFTCLCLLYISKCFNCDINVELLNSAALNQGNPGSEGLDYAGRYEATDPVNGRQAWVQVDGANGLWNFGSGWMFGPAEKIGENLGSILGLGPTLDCPQNVTTWLVWKEPSWTPVNSSDIIIGCAEGI